MMDSASVLHPSADTCLRNSSQPALRRLQVLETDVEVVITGRVYSYYLKQLAQETIRPALGDRRLINRVKVVSKN